MRLDGIFDIDIGFTVGQDTFDQVIDLPLERMVRDGGGIRQDGGNLHPLRLTLEFSGIKLILAQHTLGSAQHEREEIGTEGLKRRSECPYCAAGELQTGGSGIITDRIVATY